MAFDILIRSLYTDSGAGAGLAKLNAGLDEVGKSAPGARSGLRAVETGINRLAFEAIGAAGPLGRVAEGFLRIGGGAGLGLAAATVIGLVGLAFKEMGADAERAASNVEAAATRMHNALKAAVGEGFDTDRRGLFVQRLAQTRAQIDSLLAAPLGPQRFGATTGGLVPLGSPEQDRLEQLRGLNTLLGQLTSSLAELDRNAEHAAEEGLQKLRDELAGINAEIGRFEVTLPRALQEIPIPSLKDILQGPNFQKFLTKVDEASIDAAVRFGRGPDKAGTKANIEAVQPKPGQGLNASAIAASSVALLGAASQGGAGGILTAGGGLLAAAGLGVPGIIATSLGGLFSLFDHSEERRTNRIVAELTRIRENTTKRDQPDHVSVTLLVNGKEITAAIIGDIAYGLNRMARTNGTPILPPS